MGWALLGVFRAGAAESLAQFHTPMGDWLALLHDDDKPVTVANFRRYVSEGRFADTFVQRWAPGFVIQGGGYYVTQRGTPEAWFGAVPVYGMIPNEYDVGRRFSNVARTLAMARVGGQTNSATSQWFVNLADNQGLDDVDGGFTVFGRVLAGWAVLERFNNVSASNGLYRVAVPNAPALTTVPVLSANPTLDDLVYTAISLPEWPRMRVEWRADGTRQVTWNSLSNFMNHVETAPTPTGVWQTVLSTNGTGLPLAFLDLSPAGSQRFYRLRVE